MLEEIIPGVHAEKANDGCGRVEIKPEVLILKAKAGNLPNCLGLDQIAHLLDEDFYDFLDFITSEPVRIAFDQSLTMVISKTDYKEYLISINKWPLPEDCLLSGWLPDDEPYDEPWLKRDVRDKPAATQDWQIAARYFYRQYKRAKPELLKNDIIAFVHDALREHELFKRGGKEFPSQAAISKILQNIKL